MLKSQPKPFPSVFGLVGIAVTSTLMLWLAPWAHEEFMPSLHVDLRVEMAVVLCVAFGGSSLLTLLFKWLAKKKTFDDEWLMLTKHMPREQVVTEVREVAPYLEVMSKQLDGAVKETEHGVMGLINSLNTIHQVSQHQLQRINASEESGTELATALRDKVMVDKQLGLILQMFVDKQQQDVEINLGRIKRLQEIKGLTALVADISQVAKQTNILAINAAVEAARAGDAGRGFAVLAAEIRELSNRTAGAAVSISLKIKTATEGIDEEMHNATEVEERNSATGSMRKVIADVDGMQHRFAAASQHLLEIIEGVKAGHQDIVLGLSEALGQIQFQDVIRQRVEQVQKAQEELNDHLQSLADQLIDKPWDPQTMVTLRQRLDDQMSSYVMQSQRDTHHDVVGKTTPSADARPNIELF
ncbi:MAG: methyl-accepting chemotaxis protein [Comamonadaceae bacterium]|nr:methyl-accepting chemotaxis protein [Comamonadaceae bacterium]